MDRTNDDAGHRPSQTRTAMSDNIPKVISSMEHMTQQQDTQKQQLINQNRSQSSSTQQSANVTRISSKYIRDFESLFIDIHKEQLREHACNGQLRQSQFRSLYWRLFLRCLPDRYDKWLEVCRDNRRLYEQINVKYMATRDLSDAETELRVSASAPTSPTNHNPTDSPSQLEDDKQNIRPEGVQTTSKISAKTKELEDEQQYLKAASQCDHKNVFRTIERDVVRTFPDMEFFRQTDMQNILENVLYNFASENPHLSYKQGMHELVATLLYVLHTDSQNCLINYQGGYANDDIYAIMDLKYLEHDVYHLFCALMKSIESWYQNDEILKSPSANDVGSAGAYPTSRYKTGGRQQVSSVLSIKLKKISESVVKKYDPELFYHLEALQIEPQIYGIRWMRLLFGREFEFLDLLTVWDATICDIKPMSLTDYIFASMLITIRDELVNGDYTDCLNNLMRHQFKDVQYVIKLALHLREPSKYVRPKMIFTNPLQRKANHTLQAALSYLNQDYNTMKSRYNQARKSLSITQTNAKLGNLRPQSTNLPELKSPITSHIREYEMREMQSQTSSGTQRLSQTNRNTLDSLAAKTLNISTESYDDLHSIVDYCWRLLSEQIDSLQKCLPREKCLSSEDEIFVALAQLKKVRDVLKGSLRLEDEFKSPASGGKS